MDQKELTIDSKGLNPVFLADLGGTPSPPLQTLAKTYA